jgi:hypothetical protein
MELSKSVDETIEILRKIYPDMEFKIKDNMIIGDNNFIAWINDNKVNLNKLPEVRHFKERE